MKPGVGTALHLHLHVRGIGTAASWSSRGGRPAPPPDSKPPTTPATSPKPCCNAGCGPALSMLGGSRFHARRARSDRTHARALLRKFRRSHPAVACEPRFCGNRARQIAQGEAGRCDTHRMSVFLEALKPRSASPGHVCGLPDTRGGGRRLAIRASGSNVATPMECHRRPPGPGAEHGAAADEQRAEAAPCSPLSAMTLGINREARG